MNYSSLITIILFTDVVVCVLESVSECASRYSAWCGGSTIMPGKHDLVIPDELVFAHLIFICCVSSEASAEVRGRPLKVTSPLLRTVKDPMQGGGTCIRSSKALQGCGKVSDLLRCGPFSNQYASLLWLNVIYDHVASAKMY
jgi:hypothetical protein